MARVLLVHWKAEELAERVERLAAAGHEVEATAVTPTPIRRVVELDPEVLVVDLGRLPSHGREVADALCASKKTRHIRIVFVAGQPAKVERARSQFPGATFVQWSGIAKGIERALASRKPAAPRKPAAVARPGGYSGTPLPKKLGIKPRTTIALLDAPPGFDTTLGPLPPEVTVRRDARGTRALTLWFVTSARRLRTRAPKLAAQVGDGGLWICWPKKSSKLATEVAEADVRAAGLDAGLVDYKICAVDADWSGLKFSRRRSE